MTNSDDTETKVFQLEPYACLRVTTSEGNCNENITKPLEEIETFYRNSGDFTRELAYRRAIAAIKVCPRTIKNAKELFGIQYIGMECLIYGL